MTYQIYKTRYLFVFYASYDLFTTTVIDVDPLAEEKVVFLLAVGRKKRLIFCDMPTELLEYLCLMMLTLSFEQLHL